MGTATEVEEVSGVIDADLVAFHLVVDQLELVVLAAFAKLVDRLSAGEGLLHKWAILMDDPAHARFDRGQVGLSDRR